MPAGMNRIVRRGSYIAGSIALTLILGTIGFMTVEGWPLFDSFYMTLTTMTTVGYSEIHPLSRSGRVFNVFLIFFGVTTMFLAIGAMTQTVIETQFGDFIERRRVRKMIQNLRSHFIICG